MTTTAWAAVESNRGYTESTVVHVAVVGDRPANRGSTTALVVGDIGTLGSALMCERTLAAVRHTKVEVHIGVLIGEDAEVGNGERIDFTAAANRGRRALAGLGDGTGYAFVLSCIRMIAVQRKFMTYRRTLALSWTLRASKTRESESVVVLERLTWAQPGPIPARLLGAGTCVVTLARAGEAVFDIPLFTVRVIS